MAALRNHSTQYLPHRKRQLKTNCVSIGKVRHQVKINSNFPSIGLRMAQFTVPQMPQRPNLRHSFRLRFLSKLSTPANLIDSFFCSLFSIYFRCQTESKNPKNYSFCHSCSGGHGSHRSVMPKHGIFVADRVHFGPLF